MQPAVGYPPGPGGYGYPTPQNGNYQAVQLGDNSFAQHQGMQPGMMQPGMMQQYPGMYQNPMAMPNLPGVEAYNEIMKLASKKGFQRLEEAQGVFIKQSFIFSEALASGCACESPNVFKVFPADANGKQTGSVPIFQCKDKSDCCPRYWCGADCNQMKMKVATEPALLNNATLESTMFLYLDRPCQCACLCVNRPVLNIVLQEDNQNKEIGKVKNPCYACSIGVEIEDGAGNVKYKIEGSQCQMGYICMPCCCEACLKVHFEIKDAGGQVVSHASKQTPGFCKSLDSTNFAVGFPANATAEEKALLIAGILTLDFLSFENQRRKRRRRRNH